MKKPAELVFPFVIVVILAAAFLWHRWQSGRIVAEAHYKLGEMMPTNDLHCLIRAYPRSHIPTGEYFYGCEVRWHNVLLSAVAFNWDSYTANDCSVTSTSRENVLFTVGSYRIRCSGIGWSRFGEPGAIWQEVQ